MAYIKHKFGRTFYLAKGSGKKTPLIYLHGGPGGHHHWNEPVFKLGNERKVYQYDQIGGGQSSVSLPKHWNVKTFVQELDILIDRWKLKEFHLGGGSWGTTLALEYYLYKKGKGIKSLILTSPMFSADDWKSDGKKLIAKLPAETRKIIKVCHEIGATDSKVYEKAVNAYYLRHVLRDEKKLKASDKRSKKNAVSGKLIYHFMWGPSEFEPTGTLKTYDRVADLKKIKVPTLFLCGEHDEATPKTTKRYSKLVEGAEFTVLKGCSHASLSENPKLVLKNMREFLSRVDRQVGKPIDIKK